MSKSDLWAQFVAQNPAFGRDDHATVTLTVRGLKKLFETSYDAGFSAGQAYPGSAPDKSPWPDMPEGFDRIFGRSR